MPSGKDDILLQDDIAKDVRKRFKIEKLELKKNSKYDFLLSEVIMKKQEFTGAVIYGAQREGKTGYAMKVAYDIFRSLGMKHDEAWEKVFSIMFYRLDDLVTYLREAIRRDVREPVVIWDDAGVHGNKLVYFTDATMAQLLQNLFDVVGTAARGILLTTPVAENLLKSLRDYEFLRIKVQQWGADPKRRARAYKQNRLPSGRVLMNTYFDDYFSKILPNDIYERYNPIRKRYTESALDNLDKIIKERNMLQCIRDDEMKELAIAQDAKIKIVKEI